MARQIRYHARSLRTLEEQLRWLERHRPQSQRDELRHALAAFEGRVSAFPGVGREVRRRGSVSYRVRLVEEPLPHVAYYSHDTADPEGAIRLLLLLHERQDRARFDPSDYDE